MSEIYNPQEGDVNNTNLHIRQVVQISDFDDAKITRIHYHAVWVEYADGERGCVADSDCQPVVASEPAATVERLEDLAPVRQELMLALAERTNGTIIFRAHQDYLQSIGFITVDNDMVSHITERGAALVADYQRRQGEAKVEAPSAYPTSDGRKWGELNEREQWQEYRNMRVERDALQAEVARLTAENAALKHIVDGLLQPSVYGLDVLSTLTYELGRYGADSHSQQDAMVNAVEMTIKRLRAK